MQYNVNLTTFLYTAPEKIVFVLVEIDCLFESKTESTAECLNVGRTITKTQVAPELMPSRRLVSIKIQLYHINLVYLTCS